MKQQRIPFPDYTAEQQEHDVARAKRKKTTEVYMSKVDGIWQALIPHKQDIVINGNVGQEIAEFCKVVADMLESGFKIIPRFRCIKNSGVDEY